MCREYTGPAPVTWLNRTASANLHASGVTLVVIPVTGGIAENAPVAVNC
jgi:hypothetical protein